MNENQTKMTDLTDSFLISQMVHDEAKVLSL